MPELSIIIVNWNSANYLDSCIRAIRKTTRELAYEIIVVDNASYDGSENVAYRNKDLVRFVQSDKNLVQTASRVAQALKIPITDVDLGEGASVDSMPFKDRKIPTIDFHSMTSSTLSLPGSDKDKLDQIKLDQYGNTYRLLSGYMAFLDNTLDKQPAAAK